MKMFFSFFHLFVGCIIDFPTGFMLENTLLLLSDDFYCIPRWYEWTLATATHETDKSPENNGQGTCKKILSLICILLVSTIFIISHE